MRRQFPFFDEPSRVLYGCLVYNDTSVVYKEDPDGSLLTTTAAAASACRSSLRKGINPPQCGSRPDATAPPTHSKTLVFSLLCVICPARIGHSARFYFIFPQFRIDHLFGDFSRQKIKVPTHLKVRNSVKFPTSELNRTEATVGDLIHTVRRPMTNGVKRDETAEIG